MALADQANQFIDEEKPWALVKEERSRQRVQAVCTMGLNLFRQLAGFLKPVLPGMVEEAEKCTRMRKVR